MKKLFNERQTIMESSPSDLMVLEELNKRGALNEEFKEQLSYLSGKEMGRLKMLETLKSYGREEWLYMENVAVDYYNIITCDLLVLSSTHMYTLEINEFSGAFTYREGQSYVENQKIKQHPIAMTQSVVTQLKSSMRMTPIPISLELKGAAVFTNPEHPLKIEDPIGEIEVVAAKDIKAFVKRMVKEEKQAQAKGGFFNPMNLSWVARIDRHHPYIPIEIPPAIMEKMRPGILCAHCGSFEVMIGEVLMTCECGGWETIEETIIRTVCAYAVLDVGDQLHIPALRQFFNDQIPWHQVEKGLEKIYQVVR